MRDLRHNLVDKFRNENFWREAVGDKPARIWILYQLEADRIDETEERGVIGPMLRPTASSSGKKDDGGRNAIHALNTGVPGQARADSARGVFSAHHKTEKRSKAHRRGRPDKVQAGHGGFEHGVQPWSAFETRDAAAEALVEKLQAIDAEVITGARDHIVDDQLMFATVLSSPKAKHCLPVSFKCVDDQCLGVNGNLVLDSFAKPPGAFGRQVVFHKAGPPCRRDSVHRAREAG